MKPESSDTPATTTTQPAAPSATTTSTTVGAASTSSSSTASGTGTGTGTPTTTYATQWANSQIPIDPALQQQSATAYQHYQTYASHYPTAAYPSHYQAYAPQRSANSAASTTGTTAGNTAGSTGAGNTNVDATDIATLNDALGSAGVDLRAEEESLQRTGDTQHQHQAFRSYDDRSKKQPPTPNFDTRFLSQTIRTLSTPHKITRIPDDSVNYLALALRARLQDLITSMIMAAKHRTSTQFDRPASHYSDDQPMWSIVVRSDVAKQLAAIERAEREEETKIRRERKERADLAAAHAAALAAQANAAGVAGFAGMGHGAAVPPGVGMGEDEYEGGTKKKRKKDGPGVTARNMSEDVRKKMSNAVATQAAGLGGKYAWMNAATLNSPIPPKPKPVATATSTTTTATTTATTAATSTTAGTSTATTGGVVGTAGTTSATTTATTTTSSSTLTSSWATPYISTKSKQNQTQEETDTRLAISMRDAMFVIEKERGHGAGRGSARGWV